MKDGYDLVIHCETNKHGCSKKNDNFKKTVIKKIWEFYKEECMKDYCKEYLLKFDEQTYCSHKDCEKIIFNKNKERWFCSEHGIMKPIYDKLQNYMCTDLAILSMEYYGEEIDSDNVKKENLQSIN